MSHEPERKPLPTSWVQEAPFDWAELYGREPVGSMDDLPERARTEELKRWQQMMQERGPRGD
jgi:hypothetical protein